MLNGLETIRMARAMNAHAARRMTVIAGNLANADTPGYRARDLRPFDETYRGGGTSSLRATRAGHLRDAGGGIAQARLVEDRGGRAPNGNSVSLEAEMMRSADASRQHELSLAVYRSSLTMLRSALGRAR
ncbi:FlgB family protein [Paracoccus sediminicola]|uniref:FlgB family protein n=1 Tax=Paracoccus sediminicola TaxID=3017783 RepID=UPI0022F0C2D3|nr:FlgB family protein [Paracoccus sediminicola]WBU56932.1 FlgB family protein [Paracoccus sediminicola]